MSDEAGSFRRRAGVAETICALKAKVVQEILDRQWAMENEQPLPDTKPLPIKPTVVVHPSWTNYHFKDGRWKRKKFA